MTVVPRAQDAATARIGYSSIIEGARPAGTSTPLSDDPALTRQVGDRLAALALVGSGREVGAHLAQVSGRGRPAAG
jgi:hypothetical protein